MTHNPDRRTALLGLAVAAGTAAFGSASAKAAQSSGASLPALETPKLRSCVDLD